MIKAEDLLAARLPAGPRPAPTGRRLTFLLTEYAAQDKAYVTNLWVAADSGIRPLTRGGGTVSQPRWSPDGRFLAYTARPARTQNAHTQIWLMPMEGGEPYPVTTSPTPAHSPAWSPDGSRLLYLALDPASEEEAQLEARGGTRRVDAPPRMQQIWCLDVAGGGATRLTRDRTTKADPVFSPDGRTIAFARRPDPTCNHDYHSSIWIMDADGRGKRRLGPPQGSATQPRFAPDGSRLAFLHRRLPAYGYPDRVAVAALDGTAGQLLTEDLDRPAVELAWGQDDRIHFLLHDGLRQHLWSVPARGGQPEQLTRGDRSLSGLALSADGQRALYVSAASHRPGELHLCNADGSDEKTLTDFNPHLDKAQLGRTRAVSWKAPDGQRLEGLLTLPAKHRKGRKIPLIVEPHGGPAGARTFSFSYTWQFLAARGYAVFAPNFRGSAGYGEAFVTANIDDFGGGDFGDIMAGVDHLVGRGIADPRRLGIMGYSYGGFMTGWAIGHTDRFKAAVAGAGVHNLQSFFGTTDIQWFTQHYQRGFPWERPEAYARQSPVTYAERMQTPTLVYHGDEDRRVPLEQSEQLYMALKHRKVPTQFIRYPREAHGIAEYPHRLDLLERMLEWFDRYVKGKKQKKS